MLIIKIATDCSTFLWIDLLLATASPSNIICVLFIDEIWQCIGILSIFT